LIEGSDEFSVYWYDASGFEHRELSFVSAKLAIHRTSALVESVAGRLGFIKRIIITDGGDYMNFEWKHSDGVTFPPESKKEGKG
jgi:hypothetical protein